MTRFGERSKFRIGGLITAVAVAASSPAAADPLAASPLGAAMCVYRAVVDPISNGAYLDRDLVLGARVAWSEGRLDDARAMLDEAMRRFPRIGDHLAVMLGEIELEAGDPAAARTRFESALASESPSVRVEARIGRVRSLIDLGSRDAPRELEALLQDYPELPDAERLAFARAAALEREGSLAAAAEAYRDVDLEYPGSVLAADARARMAVLLSNGTAIAPYSAAERVDRAARLTSSGPIPAAHATVDLLLADASLSDTLRKTVLRLAIRIARVEGRFADVTDLEQRLRERGVAVVEAPSADDILDNPYVDATDGEARARSARAAMARILHGRVVGTAPIESLGELADVAAGGGLDDSLRAIVDRAREPGVPPEVKFAVAMAASSRPDFEETALLMLASFGNAGGDLATGARYHRARLLERLGRLDEARSLFDSVLNADRSSGQYYSLWCAQRLPVVHAAIAARAETTDPGTSSSADSTVPVSMAVDAGLAAPVRDASPGSSEPPATSGARGSRTFDLDAELGREVAPSDLELAPLADELDSIAGALAPTYPWIGRAADLLRVHAIEEARAELFESLVAHRLASGRPVHAYGLDAVSRGVSGPPSPRARISPSRPPRSARGPARVVRHPLEAPARNIIADVAAALGDHGTAIALGGEHSADERPRAFALEVASAARQFDVDPNLLWAVMRVESVYQPRIVSYAGAIGLMQIMPRTGRLIAERLGRDRFTTAQLLDPQTNIDFAAWYLHSLIERFDGYVPLAIAAYNGGPHNVRVWLDRAGPDVPMDAFLERIPFDQTNRYVRRVLSHYAAYRARDGLPMIDLGVGVPPTRPDEIAF